MNERENKSIVAYVNAGRARHARLRGPFQDLESGIPIFGAVISEAESGFESVFPRGQEDDFLRQRDCSLHLAIAQSALPVDEIRGLKIEYAGEILAVAK